MNLRSRLHHLFFASPCKQLSAPTASTTPHLAFPQDFGDIPCRWDSSRDKLDIAFEDCRQIISALRNNEAVVISPTAKPGKTYVVYSKGATITVNRQLPTGKLTRHDFAKALETRLADCKKIMQNDPRLYEPTTVEECSRFIANFENLAEIFHLNHQYNREFANTSRLTLLKSQLNTPLRTISQASNHQALERLERKALLLETVYLVLRKSAGFLLRNDEHLSFHPHSRLSRRELKLLGMILEETNYLAIREVVSMANKRSGDTEDTEIKQKIASALQTALNTIEHDYNKTSTGFSLLENMKKEEIPIEWVPPPHQWPRSQAGKILVLSIALNELKTVIDQKQLDGSISNLLGNMPHSKGKAEKLLALQQHIMQIDISRFDMRGLKADIASAIRDCHVFFNQHALLSPGARTSMLKAIYSTIEGIDYP